MSFQTPAVHFSSPTIFLDVNQPMYFVIDVASLSNQLLLLDPRCQVTLPYPIYETLNLSVTPSLVRLYPLTGPLPARVFTCLQRSNAPAFLHRSVLLLVIQSPLTKESSHP